MTEEQPKPTEEKKEEVKETKVEEKPEAKPEEKKEEKKEAPKISKKDEAVTKGDNLHTSLKHCMYICDFIKNKPIDTAIEQLQEVLKFKRVIPYRGEIPHRKGNIMSGRYPIKASKLFIPMLKTLRGNVITNQMDLDKTRIYFASASWAARPARKGGRRFKRTNVVLKAKEIVK